MSDPKVTIILPIYNGEKTLRATVESLLAQSYGDFELIACIDGTTDGSIDILKSFGDPRIRILENPENMGLGATLNKMVAHSRSSTKYIAMAEQDDYYYPYRLREQVDHMEAHPEVGMVSGIAEHWNGQEVKSRFPGLLDRGESYPEGKEMFLLNYIHQVKVVNSCMLFRKSVHFEHGLYFSRHYPSISVDWSYILRFSLVGKIAGLPRVFVRLDRRPDRSSLTAQRRKRYRATWELLRSFKYEYPDLIDDEVYRQACKTQLLLELKSLDSRPQFIWRYCSLFSRYPFDHDMLELAKSKFYDVFSRKVNGRKIAPSGEG